MQRSITGQGSITRSAVAVISCLALMYPAFADQSTQANLQEGTPVRVAIEQTIKSGADKAGEPIKFEVSEDVYDANHSLVIPKGAEADGVILQSSRRGMFGKAGKLKFTCDYVVAGDQLHVPLRGDSTLVRGRDNRGATAAVVVLVSPFGLLINGRDVTIKEGTVFTMYVDKSTAVPQVNG